MPLPTAPPFHRGPIGKSWHPRPRGSGCQMRHWSWAITGALFNQPGSCDWPGSRQTHAASPPGGAHSDIYFLPGSPRAELAGWGFPIVFKPQLAPLNCPSLSLCPFPNPGGKNNCPPFSCIGRGVLNGALFWVAEENLDTDLGSATHRRDEGVCCFQFGPQSPAGFFSWEEPRGRRHGA